MPSPIASVALIAASHAVADRDLIYGRHGTSSDCAANWNNDDTYPDPIRGIIPPVLTPLLDRDTLDEAPFDACWNTWSKVGRALCSFWEAPASRPA